MNKLSHKLILFGYITFSVLTFLLAAVSPGYAQTPEPAAASTPLSVTPTPPPTGSVQATAIPFEQSPPGITEVAFSQLDQSAIELRSPISQQSFTFEIPYRWVIAGGESYIELHYDWYSPVSQTTTLTGTGAVNALTEVYFNNTLAASFTPTAGSDQTIRIPIPPSALNVPNQDSYEISIIYFSENCDNTQSQSTLVIHDHSFVHFKYTLKALEINLADFPRPLMQNLFSPESILLVIPDAYSDADLATAASVAAAIGQRTSNSVAVDVVTAADATPERLANTSAVIIGQPGENAFLLDLYQRQRLPTTLADNGSLITGSVNQPISADDGVLQEILSDYSDDHVYLIVTGNSDIAVARAAQTLSVLSPRYGIEGNLVVVADFHQFLPAESTATDRFTLAELGFKDTTLRGIGTQSANMGFFIPSNWTITGSPTLTLSYIHSAQLQSSGSGLLVELNNKPVGSAPIDQNALGERQVAIELSKSDFISGGRNRFNFVAAMNVSFPDCALLRTQLAWLRIREDSQLYLPHIEKDVEVAASLKDPLTPFSTRQDLSDVWFSMPENPTPTELTGLVRVAAWLGNLNNGLGFAPRVSREVISDTVQLDPYHIIAFGLPTSNPLIAMLNEQLPQPFVPGEDNLRQEVGNVVYRLPQGFSLGLLQALPAPWNPQKSILVVTGTDPEGMQWALNTLTDDLLYYELSGDLAFIRTNYLETFTSAKFVRGPLLAAVEAIATAEATPLALEKVEPTPDALPAPASVSSALATPQPGHDTVPAAIPQQYLPPDHSPSIMISRLIMGLIGAGVVIAAAGGVVSWRKAKIR